jgi:hypothetical protein
VPGTGTSAEVCKMQGGWRDGSRTGFRCKSFELQERAQECAEIEKPMGLLLPYVSKRKHGKMVFEDVQPVPTVGTGMMQGWSTDG